MTVLRNLAYGAVICHLIWLLSCQDDTESLVTHTEKDKVLIQWLGIVLKGLHHLQQIILSSAFTANQEVGLTLQPCLVILQQVAVGFLN